MAMAQTSLSPKCSLGDLCNNTMKPLLTRYLRGAVLGMMLLLSGMAGMVCFSYDADGDDSTPPVTVEFNGVVPSKKVFRFPVRVRALLPSTLATFSPAPVFSR